MGFVTGALQFSVAGYALRLNRIFGTARVGWSLFWAFSLLALLHLFQSIELFNGSAPLGVEVEVMYGLISLLMLTGLVHIETLLKEHLRIEREEKRLLHELESQVKQKTAHLTRAIEELQTEIDERKRMEAVVRASEENLNRAQAVAQTGSWHLDIRNDALTSSEETQRIFGIRPPQTLTLEYFTACIHPADKEAALQAWNAALRGAPYDIEHRILIGNEVKWVRKRAEISFDAQGNAREGIGTVQDITERKNAEGRIIEQARLLDLAHDAIMVGDMEDRILYWNKGAERLYGWTAREAAGRKLEELFSRNGLNGFNAFKYEEARKTILETGYWHGEFAIQLKGGNEMFVEARWTLVRDGQGAPKSVLGISTDITEKKKFETQFFRAQRMESLGTLASGIAHDLNNVLTPLLMSVQLLKEKVADEDGRKLLHALEANVQRGAGLVKQVLAFGRGMEGPHIQVNPKHIAGEIRQIIQETFPKTVEFESDCAADLWTITGDPTQLHQVLLNLCVNARDAMPKGGTLSLRMENVMVDETHAAMNLDARPGPYVVISVADTGTGIPKEIQDKMFDPFFTTKEPGKGTGLGLFTTLSIVNSHDGFILCQSEVGKGATFKVYFPATRTPEAAEKAPEEDSGQPRGHNELVLVVDDEQTILNLAQKVLKRAGYRVLLASDGVEAISLYAHHRQDIDVVIMDTVMPVIDGPVTIAALKAINANVKIVSSSGAASVGGTARAWAAGVQHFVPKPYTADTMLKTLREVLRKNNAL
jgi:hypothetical protein